MNKTRSTLIIVVTQLKEKFGVEYKKSRSTLIIVVTQLDPRDIMLEVVRWSTLIIVVAQQLLQYALREREERSTLIIVVTQPTPILSSRLRVSLSPSGLLLLDRLKRISMANTLGDGLVFYWQHCY